MVTLDQLDSNLDMRVNTDDALSASCLHTEGFQYMWKGIRATHGVLGGAYYYEVKITKNCMVEMPDTAPKNQNIVRVGASLPLSSLFLGDTPESWGYGGTEKKATNNQFSDFGGAFGVGDVIGVVMDVDNLSISYTKNGRFMGIAFNDVAPAAKTVGLFPHILVKNCEFAVNFSRENAWFQPPSNVYFLDEAPSMILTDNPIDHPRRLEESEFIMMVGLPACGKTYWAMKHMEENPRKNYLLLG
jgi:heterogeneous nuclear ribonucleoprotein U-like protein 1